MSPFMNFENKANFSLPQFTGLHLLFLQFFKLFSMFSRLKVFLSLKPSIKHVINPTLSGLRDVRVLPGGRFKDTL